MWEGLPWKHIQHQEGLPQRLVPPLLLGVKKP